MKKTYNFLGIALKGDLLRLLSALFEKEDWVT
jgi:hypothetical protein